jgi:hypothetical protein
MTRQAFQRTVAIPGCVNGKATHLVEYILQILMLKGMILNDQYTIGLHWAPPLEVLKTVV